MFYWSDLILRLVSLEFVLVKDIYFKTDKDSVLWIKWSRVMLLMKTCLDMLTSADVIFFSPNYGAIQGKFCIQRW